MNLGFIIHVPTAPSSLLILGGAKVPLSALNWWPCLLVIHVTVWMVDTHLR